MAGGAGAVNVGGSNNGGGVSKGPREPSAVRAAKAVEGIKTVDACHVRQYCAVSCFLAFLAVVGSAWNAHFCRMLPKDCSIRGLHLGLVVLLTQKQWRMPLL